MFILLMVSSILLKLRRSWINNFRNNFVPAIQEPFWCNIYIYLVMSLFPIFASPNVLCIHVLMSLFSDVPVSPCTQVAMSPCPCFPCPSFPMLLVFMSPYAQVPMSYVPMSLRPHVPISQCPRVPMSQCLMNPSLHVPKSTSVYDLGMYTTYVHVLQKFFPNNLLENSHASTIT